MVISGSILAFLGAVFPTYISISAFGGLGTTEILLMIILLLSIVCLFSRRHPSFGVIITLLSLYEMWQNEGTLILTAFLILSVIGGTLITVQAHENWIERKEAHYNGL